jgi:prefoldin subunit 5
MEESNSVLEEEKAELEERIRLLEEKIQDLNLGLHHTRNALDGQREKLYEFERDGFDSSAASVWKAQMKISRYEEDMNSLESRLRENNRELNSCKEWLKTIEVLIADSTVRGTSGMIDCASPPPVS